MPDKSILSAFFPAPSEGATHISEERSSLITFYVLENWKVLVVIVMLIFLMMASQMVLKISKVFALLSLLVFLRN